MPLSVSLIAIRPFLAHSNRDAGRPPPGSRVRPALIGYCRRPAWPQRILVVRIRTKPPVQLRILSQFVPIQTNAETRPSRHVDRAVHISERASLDDVISQMMIVRIGGKRQIGYDRP